MQRWCSIMNQDPLLVDNFLNRICFNQLKPQMCGYPCRSNCTFDPCKHGRLIDVENRYIASTLVNQVGRALWCKEISRHFLSKSVLFSENAFLQICLVFSGVKSIPFAKFCPGNQVSMLWALCTSTYYLSMQGSKRGPLLALDKRPSFFGSKDWKMVVFT